MKQFKKCQLAELFHDVILKQQVRGVKRPLDALIEIWKLLVLSSSFSSGAASSLLFFSFSFSFHCLPLSLYEMPVCIAWIRSYILISLWFSAFLLNCFIWLCHLAILSHEHNLGLYVHYLYVFLGPAFALVQSKNAVPEGFRLLLYDLRQRWT